MTDCDRTQRKLAELFPELAQLETEVREHLQTCPECTRFHADLARLESSLQQLPVYDVADPKVIQALAAQVSDNRQTHNAKPKKRWPLALAATVILGLGITALVPLFMAADYRVTSEDTAYRYAETQALSRSRRNTESGSRARAKQK